MATLTVMLSLFAASLVTINANDHRHIGTGFVGTRGKRSIEDDTGNWLETIGRSTNADRIANFSSSSFNSVVPDHTRNLPELSIFKRAPSGFMGMRGKKDSEYSDFVRREQLLDENEDVANLKGKKLFLNAPLRFMKGPFPFPFPKRAPSGFLGMRGKKLLLAENNKRGPQGFVGMRGKKDVFDLLYDSSAIDANQQMLEAIQNEQNLLNDIRQLYDYDSDDYNKRAPSSGFFGMRGKKLSDENFYDDIDSIEKRAPSGFLGMRGKKSIDYQFDSVENDKRAPMGFVGMRGKKDVSAQVEKQKRSSLAQLFGIRGKKQPLNSGFFGMRGKKQPMEFRGKFVGVRGKKAEGNSLQLLEEQLDSIENSVPKAITEDLSELKEESNSKTVLNGSVGIQGKNLPDESSSQD